jgi:hypothetical protein
MVFGLLVWFLVPLGNFWKASGRLWGHLAPFGWPVPVSWGASAGKRIHDNFFDHLGGSWSDFWCLWVPFGKLSGAFGGHLGAFGWPVAIFLGFLPENVKLWKIVFYIMKINVFSGGGVLEIGILTTFGFHLVLWRVLGSFLGIVCYEIGYRTLWSCKMGGRRLPEGAPSLMLGGVQGSDGGFRALGEDV